MRLRPKRKGTLRTRRVRTEHKWPMKGVYLQKPNLNRYIASVGWSETVVYAGGSIEHSYGGGARASTSMGVAARASSCRLSRVPRELEAPKKSSTALDAVSSMDALARVEWMRAGAG